MEAVSDSVEIDSVKPPQGAFLAGPSVPIIELVELGNYVRINSTVGGYGGCHAVPFL
jgi:hypothetical protein